MIAQLWTVVQSVITGFFTSFGSAVTGAVDIFYEAESGFTTAGQFLLVGFGVGLCVFGLRLIMSLVRLKGSR